MSAHTPLAIAPSDIVDAALAAATDHITVIVEHDQRLDLRFAASTMTTNGAAATTAVSVIAFDSRADGRRAVGTCSGSVRAIADVVDLVQRAESAARAAAPAEDDMPFPPAIADEWTDEVPEIVADALSPTATDLGAAFRDRPSMEFFGYAEHTRSTLWLADSRGMRRVHHQSAGRLEINAKTDQRSRSAWVGRSTVDFQDLSVPVMLDDLVTRVEWGKAHVDVPAGRHRVILPPGAVADLLIPAHWAAASRDAREGHSAYAAPGAFQLGAQVAPAGWSIASDPHDVHRPVRPFVATGASSSWSSVFDNGAELEPVSWIDNGVVRHLVGSRAEQRKAPTARTSADNLIVTAGQATGSVEDLVARTEHGLLLTCLWYIREVDPQTLLSTGLTRDGVYVVRDGRVIGQAGNFRFNESPLAILGRVVDAGAAQVAQPREWADYVDQVVAPPVVIDGFNLSTPSDAL